jgi:2,3-diketo-5-methylthio-1-phosphopentane phosphatase/HAD superfamily hydrolase (TIGR01509 family)
MGYELLNRFSLGDWESVDREFCEGKIGSKEAYSRIENLFQGSEKEILDFVRTHSDIDPTFPEFYRTCKKSGIDVKIVSDGFDVYIRPILDLHGLSEIPFYSNVTTWGPGRHKTFSFPHGDEACGLCGTCKKRLVQTHRPQYESILYIGNGISDRCGAKEADFVFAKDSLYAYCIDQDISCHFFQSFQEILKDLKKRIRGIIFDLDGTLVEAYEAIYLGLRDAFQRFGKDIFPYLDLGHHLKGDLETTLRPFFNPEEAQEAIPVIRKKYEEVYLEKSHLLNGAAQVLENLYSQNISLAVASNKFGRFARGTLNHLGVAHFFRSIVGAGDVLRNKPFPDMIQAILRELNLTASDVVFVGDTLVDIETGQQAGVDVYALPTGFHSKKELSAGQPKRILKSLADLVKLIDCVTCKGS